MLARSQTGLRRRTYLLVCAGLAAGAIAIAPADLGASTAPDRDPSASAAQDGSAACKAANRAVKKAKKRLARARKALREADTPSEKGRARDRVTRAKKKLARAKARRRRACASAGALALDGDYDHTRPATAEAPSSVCAQGDRADLAGRGYVAKLLRETPPGSGTFSELRQATGVVDMSGALNVSFGIDQGGADVRYRIDVAVTTSNGGQATGTTGPFATPFTPAKSGDCLAPHN